MKYSEQYRKVVMSHVKNLGALVNPAIIFGAGRAGWYIMKVFERYGVRIAAFVDNDPSKQNQYYGYRVISLESAAKEFPTANVFLGIFLPDTTIAVKNMLKKYSFHETSCDMAAFLFIYFIEVAGRQCDEDILAKSIYILFENYKEGVDHYGYTKDKYFISPFVTSNITQRCTLKCRDCAQLIPYYKGPVNFPIETIIRDIKQYAKAFDLVPEISIHGGEPFLHPGIGKICKEAASIPNIIYISFVTNGTVLLSDKKLQQFSKCGADIHLSGGYGSLSRRANELYDACKRNNVFVDFMFCHSTEKWLRNPPCKKHNRQQDKNNQIYRKCVSTKICCQIMDGELHRCPFSMHGSHQNLFPKYEADFIKLNSPDVMDEEFISTIHKYFTRTNALSACDYCDPDGGTWVTPAVQL